MESRMRIGTGIRIGDAPSNQSVLDRCGERVSDVQTAGDVGGRGGDDKGLAGVGGVLVAGQTVLGLKEALGGPPVVPGSLDGERIVPRRHLAAQVLLVALGRRVHERRLFCLVLFFLVCLVLLGGRVDCFGRLCGELGLSLEAFRLLLGWCAC